MNYRYVYQRSGGPLLSWKDGPPRQTRAADSVALGSLGNPTLELPVPGGPEPIGDCQCHAKQQNPLAGLMDAIPGGAVGLLAVAGLAYYVLLRKKR